MSAKRHANQAADSCFVLSLQAERLNDTSAKFLAIDLAVVMVYNFFMTSYLQDDKYTQT